jgi:hypothetical protein
MNRQKLAILILLAAAVPFFVYCAADYVKGYIPPTESYKKTPAQFEQAFNEIMGEYGMSIDVNSVDFENTNGRPFKAMPVQCSDGSSILCTFTTTAAKQKSLLMHLKFEQQLNNTSDETVYIEPLLEFVMQEFFTPMYEEPDKTFASFAIVTILSYNEALQSCRTFIDSDESELVMYVATDKEEGSGITITKDRQDPPSITISVYLWGG